jgi:hypothetical protein
LKIDALLQEITAADYRQLNIEAIESIGWFKSNWNKPSQCGTYNFESSGDKQEKL